MNDAMSINVDGHPDVLGRVGRRMFALREQADRMVCLLDARIRTLTSEPKRGRQPPNTAVVCGRVPVSPRYWSHHEIRCRQDDADQHHQESAERRVIHAEAMVETPYR